MKVPLTVSDIHPGKCRGGSNQAFFDEAAQSLKKGKNVATSSANQYNCHGAMCFDPRLSPV